MKELTVLTLAVLLAVAGEPAPDPKPSLLEQAQAKAEQASPTLADVDKRERKRCFASARGTAMLSRWLLLLLPLLYWKTTLAVVGVAYLILRSHDWQEMLSRAGALAGVIFVLWGVTNAESGRTHTDGTGWDEGGEE